MSRPCSAWIFVATTTEGACHTRNRRTTTTKPSSSPTSCIRLSASEARGTRGENCIPGRRLRLIVLTQVLTSSRCIAQSRRPDGPTARPTPESAERSPHSSAFILLVRYRCCCFDWNRVFECRAHFPLTSVQITREELLRLDTSVLFLSLRRCNAAEEPFHLL